MPLDLGCSCRSLEASKRDGMSTVSTYSSSSMSFASCSKNELEYAWPLKLLLVRFELELEFFLFIRLILNDDDDDDDNDDAGGGAGDSLRSPEILPRDQGGRKLHRCFLLIGGCPSLLGSTTSSTPAPCDIRTIAVTLVPARFQRAAVARGSFPGDDRPFTCMFCSSASVADGGDDNDRDGIFQRNALRTSLAAFQNRPANLAVAISAASAAACGAVGDDEEGGSALAVPSSKESSKSCAASRSPPFGLDLDLALERRSADASSTWRDSSSASEPRRSKGKRFTALGVNYSVKWG